MDDIKMKKNVIIHTKIKKLLYITLKCYKFLQFMINDYAFEVSKFF